MQAKGGEATVVGKALHAEEEARKLDTDVVSLRQRVVQLEGKLRTRDKEVERLTGQASALPNDSFMVLGAHEEV